LRRVRYSGRLIRVACCVLTVSSAPVAQQPLNKQEAMTASRTNLIMETPPERRSILAHSRPQCNDQL
ncbi:MAG: hypothetical protein M3R04_02320, partial [bacterium]|nr:hypothetical protein [bacterium]